MDTITSAKNPTVRALRALKDRRTREETGRILVEGEVMIREALSSGLRPIAALSEEELPLLAELRGADVKLCSRSVLKKVCDTKTPQGVCAAFEIPRAAAIPEGASCLLALDGVQDPGNVGTILRTADAAGFEGVLMSARTADIYSPKVQRSAMGSGFRVSCVRCELGEALDRYAEAGWKTVVSTLDGKDLYENAEDYRREKMILVIGNEARGVSEEIRARADIRLKIPMRGKAESLNAAVAAGILMYELTRGM